MISKYFNFVCVLLVVAVFLCLSGQEAGATPILLTEVPAYDWYHGCGPTAAGSIIGYWDLHGYSNLFDAEGWDNVRLTSNVQDQISSPEHNARYDPTPDDTTQPQSWNSIADWFRTSKDPLDYGSSYVVYADDAFIGYAGYRGYSFDAYYKMWGAFTWNDLISEITAGNPMMFMVDTDGSGEVDHAVPVLGYDDRGEDGRWYGLYTTWSENETIVWKEFLPIGNSWGVGYGTFVHAGGVVPEPATVFLLGSGLLGLAGALIKRRKNRF